MKNMRFVATLIATLTWAVYAAPNSTQSASNTERLFADPVVAKGKGFEIKQSDVEEAFIDYKANMASRGQTIPEPQRPLVESNLLQRIIVTKVLVNRATDEDKAKARTTTEKLIADAKKQYSNEEAFRQQLKATGMSPEQFHARALEQATCEMVIEREVRSTITITDAVAKKFYEDNPERFERPETVRAAHILFSTVDKASQQPVPPEKKREKEMLARKVKERAEKGEDFAMLAKEFSEDPGSKDKGGEYVFARGEMVPEFETAAFSLKTNQISDLVETRFGFHIIKLLQKIPPEKVEFAKVLPDLKEGLAKQGTQEMVPAFIEKIKKEANVELIDPDAGSAPEPGTSPVKK